MGYGSGKAAAPKGNGGLLQVYTFPTPGLLPSGSHSGVSQRLLPRAAEKQKTKEKQQKTSPLASKKKSPTPLLLRPLRGELDLHLDLRLAFRHLLGGRCLVLGCLRASAPFSLRGRGGDLHLHASWRASFLAAQASARAPCGPLQLAHLIVACGHPRPRPARHPSTEHR